MCKRHIFAVVTFAEWRETKGEMDKDQLSILRRLYKADIDEACRVMCDGGVILYPTDTIWGIGCDATNEEAVRRVYEIKQREDSKALIVLVDSVAKVNAHVDAMPDVAWDLIEVATTPLTIIYDRGKNLAPNLLAEDGSVGIRVTDEPFSHDLCFRFKRPIVSTSANISGHPSPANYSEIDEDLKARVDYIVGYRRDDKSVSKPSGIIKLGAGGEVKIIR